MWPGRPCGLKAFAYARCSAGIGVLHPGPPIFSKIPCTTFRHAAQVVRVNNTLSTPIIQVQDTMASTGVEQKRLEAGGCGRAALVD